MKRDDSLSALFDAERLEAPPRESVERGLAELRASLAAGVSPLPVARGPLHFGVPSVLKWLAGGLVSGVMVGAGWALGPFAPEPASPRPAPPPAETARTVPLPRVAAPTAEGPVAPPPPAPLEPRSSVAPAPRPIASAEIEPDSTFAEELRLISLAKQEHDGGRAHLAEVWLDEHARRFPHGVFASERDALRVLVGCRSGSESSRDRARAFVTANPRSPLVDRIGRACHLNGEPRALPVGSTGFPDAEKNK
jgi:hypothetical protein